MRLFSYLLQTSDNTGNLIINVYNVYKNAAITSSCQQCAQEGLRILSEGGSAVDCAITTLLCAGIRNPERLGLGGGFVATVYTRADKQARILIAREVAPQNATEKIFQSEDGSLFGGRAVAVPGSLQGYLELHRRYGRLPWRRLVEPAIKMCQDGVYVHPFTRYGLEQVERDIYKSKTLRDILVDPFSGKVKTKKHKIFRKTLGRTLEEVAAKGSEVIYNGTLTDSFVRDIQDADGIITSSDLNNYKSRWLQPIYMTFNKTRIIVPPPPSSGIVLLCILQALNRDKTFVTLPEHERWHRLIEIWKHSYGFRSKLGDPMFIPEVSQIVHEMLQTETTDRILRNIRPQTNIDFRYYGGKFQMPQDDGTAHVNVVTSNGDAVSVTDSINSLFGAMFRSTKTGIILNNTMNDFSIPGVGNMFAVPLTAANRLEAGKTPLTSMVPTIIVDEVSGDIRLLIGGAGGIKIITAVSQVLLHHLILGKDVQEAVNAPRLHHQLLPVELEHEIDFSNDILHQLWLRGHKPQRMKRQAVVSIISKPTTDGPLYVMSDPRRHCANSGF